MAKTPNTRFYFIRQDNGEAYEMNSTTDVNISKDMIVTRRAVESGKSISDNSYLENAVVTFSGLITNIRNASTLINTDQFINEINDLRSQDPRVLVDVYADGQFVLNCLITNFSMNKTVNEGKGAWKTEFTLKEVEFAERAALVFIPEASQSTKNRVDKMSSKSSNTVKELPEVTPTFGLRGISSVIEVFDGKPIIKTNVGQEVSGGG